MMKYCTHPLLAVFALLAFTLPAVPGNAREPGSPRVFEIELLVFQNLVVNDGGEVWPIDYSQWFEESGKEQADTDTVMEKIDWLPEKAWRLTAERNALGRSSRYRPVAYFAWRQAVLDRSRATPVTLSGDSDRRGRAYVDGAARVAVERYLHLYLNLQLHTPVDDQRPELLELEIPEFRLSEHRRMRSGEIHYFDHPRFGVIALITPYESPPQETAPVPQAAPAQAPGTAATPATAR